jgi:transposase
MGLKRTDEFRQDAVRIALTSGLTRKQVADDLGVGMSTLNKWITAHRDTDLVSKEDLGLAQENGRLRRENRILKEEREILKRAMVFFASQKPWGLSLSKSTNLHSPLDGCAM